MSARDVDEELLSDLSRLSDAGDPPPWRAMVEGRDHTSGDSFVMIGQESDRREDLYLTRDTAPAEAATMDLVAAARNALPVLIREIHRIRFLLASLQPDSSAVAPTVADPITQERNHDLVAVELNEMETKILCFGLIDWGGPSRCTEAMARALGFKDIDDLHVEGERIAHAIGDGRPLSRRDWSRALLSAEVVFGSDLIGTGSEWTVIQGGRDADWLATLRRLRRKLPASRRHLPD